MKYLLDVNALLALGYERHEFHARVTAWIVATRQAEGADLILATCSITELGFVRILPRLPGFDGGLEGAKTLLSELKSRQSARFTFLSDEHGADRLPEWVKTPGATTDGHLLALAEANECKLATLDTDIPGSYPIPVRFAIIEI